MNEGNGERETINGIKTKKINSYKDLKVWIEGMHLVDQIYSLSARLPKEEIYALASQIKRAAISIPSNIAEGHSRSYRADYCRFVYIALGSLAELETQLYIIQQQQFVPASEVEAVFERIEYLRAMLLTLANKL